jgi:hypothetical protein
MIAAVEKILAAFDELDVDAKHEVAAEILRRSAGVDQLCGEAFDELAAEVFGGYDAEEANGAQ